MTVLTALAGIAAALVGVLKYFNYRSKKDRIAAVGTAFEAVVGALASGDEVTQMAAAIRLRRFFDPHGEHVAGGPSTWLGGLGRAEVASDTRHGTHASRLPYAADAVAVIIAILRTLPPGDFQKLLADALTSAPADLLVGVDLQRANLQNAWLGEISLPGADFFRADLSNASFKDGGVEGAQFYEARLARTRFTRATADGTNFFGADLSRARFDGAKGRGASFLDASARWAVFRDAQLAGAVFTRADLRGADFSGADLDGAAFDGAQLEGAEFGGARNLPDEIARRLDAHGRHRGTDGRRSSAPRVFLSEPAVATPQNQALVDRVALLIEQSGATVVRLRRAEYPASGSFAEVRRLIGGCTAAAIVGVPQLTVAAGTFRPGTPEEAAVSGVALATPWNQIEAGMAIALELPVLIVRARVDDGGIFATNTDASTVCLIDVDDSGPISDFDEAVGGWLRTLTSF